MSSSQSPYTQSNEASMEQIIADNLSAETSQEAPSASTQQYTTTALYAPTNFLYAPATALYTPATPLYAPATALTAPATAPGAPSSNVPDASEDFDFSRLSEMLRAEIGHSPTATSPTAVEDAATEQTGAQETTNLPSEVPPPSTQPAVIYPQPAFSLHHPELGATHTGIQKPFSCDFCGRRFTRNANRRHHERIAHADLLDSQNQPEPENTSDPAAIPAQLALSQHQSELEASPTTNPDAEKPFGCDFCGSRFTRNTSKRRHERCYHADLLNLQNQPRPENPSAANTAAEKPYSCDHCSVRFRERRSKQHHERVAHPEVESGAQQPAEEERFSCDYCSKDFKALYNKKRHERENHLAVRSFVCSVCGKIYNRSDALKTHTSMAHGISLPKGPLLQPSTSTMGPYQPLQQLSMEQDQQTQQQEEQDRQEGQEDVSLEQRGEEGQENPRKRSRDGQGEDSGDELSKRLRLQSRRSRSP